MNTNDQSSPVCNDTLITCDPKVVAEVHILDLILTVVSLKKQALTKKDKELYYNLDILERELKLLLDKNNHIQRW